MARRTVDQPATETPALHGHYDSLHGHQDEHRHLGGGNAHPHPAGDRRLGRVAEVVEYVHGEQLASARVAMREAAERELKAQVARTRVAALDDTPTEEV